jgi:peptidoglycan/LPS O-acetylase OafA/YrhL
VTVAGTGLALVTLIGVVTRPRSAVGSLLASGLMRWLGERSYSIYLWNDLARIAILSALGHTVVGDIAWIAMFVVLAEASFRFVERPLRAKIARRSGVSRTRCAGHPTADVPRRSSHTAASTSGEA